MQTVILSAPNSQSQIWISYVLNNIRKWPSHPLGYGNENTSCFLFFTLSGTVWWLCYLESARSNDSKTIQLVCIDSAINRVFQYSTGPNLCSAEERIRGFTIHRGSTIQNISPFHFFSAALSSARIAFFFQSVSHIRKIFLTSSVMCCGLTKTTCCSKVAKGFRLPRALRKLLA